jgi:hypothetical protein
MWIRPREAVDRSATHACVEGAAIRSARPRKQPSPDYLPKRSSHIFRTSSRSASGLGCLQSDQELGTDSASLFLGRRCFPHSTRSNRPARVGACPSYPSVSPTSSIQTKINSSYHPNIRSNLFSSRLPRIVLNFRAHACSELAEACTRSTSDKGAPPWDSQPLAL